jgi:glycosyltransferase 2 family protein
MAPVRDALRRHGAILRVLVSAALLGGVLLYADVEEVVRAVRDGHWLWFVVGLALMGLCVVLGSIRWWLLLEGAQIRVRAWDSVRPFATSFVLNLVLPTAVAGDAVRTWVVGRESGRLLGAAAATIFDKLTAVTCIFGVGWGAYLVDRDAVPDSVVVVFAWVTVGMIGAFAIAALAAAGVRPILHRFPEPLAVMARDSWSTVRVWLRSTRLLVSVVGLGLAYQILVVTVLVLVGKTVGVDLPFALAAVSASVVLVATLIPVSVGGLGIREGGFVLLLGEAGVDAAEATLISLLSAGAVLLASAAVAVITYAVDALRSRGERDAQPVRGRRSASP